MPSAITRNILRHVKFGIEIEGAITNTTNVRIGSYHNASRYVQSLPGTPAVTHEVTDPDGQPITIVDVEAVAPVEVNIMIGVDGSLHDLDGQAIEIKPEGGLKFDALWPWCQAAAKFFADRGGNHNSTCGIHVHVGLGSLMEIAGLRYDSPWMEMSKWTRGMLAVGAEVETAIFAAAGSTKRMVNHYCGKIKGRFGQQTSRALEASDQPSRDAFDRYKVININRIFRDPMTATVEVRAYPTDMNADMIYAWALFSSALLHYCSERALSFQGPFPDAELPLKLHPRRGPFVTALERAFYMTGWTKGKRHGEPLMLPDTAHGAPDLDTLKELLRRRAKWLDEKIMPPARISSATVGERARRIWTYLADSAALSDTAAGVPCIHLPNWRAQVTVEDGKWCFRPEDSADAGMRAKIKRLAGFFGTMATFADPTEVVVEPPAATPGPDIMF